ncbi:uncharacterized protein [Nicotiana sylvestris]|uniref:uncharacterized protein n=1 Tax=Nicotiana sylvestris TaxID=4096 RepID=UPI00388C92D3
MHNRAESSPVVEVKEKQYNDPLLVQLKEGIYKHKTTIFSLGMDDGSLQYQRRLCVPSIDGLRERLMAEAHTSKYSVHPGSTKMYHDLKEIYWWNYMKRNVADFATRCLNCQQVKAEHQHPGSRDDHFPLIEFAYNNSFHASIKMAPFEALYVRRCKSSIGWFEVGEAELIGPDLVHQAMEKVNIIKERLKTAQSHQKSYSNVRRRDLEFKEDDSVELPPEMSLVHRVFHVSMLKKVVGDPSAIVPVKTIKVNEAQSYEEILVAILDRQVWKLRNKEIAFVKVLWRNQQVEETTLGAEEEMKKKYPHLFV